MTLTVAQPGPAAVGEPAGRGPLRAAAPCRCRCCGCGPGTGHRRSATTCRPTGGGWCRSGRCGSPGATRWGWWRWPARYGRAVPVWVLPAGPPADGGARPGAGRSLDGRVDGVPHGSITFDSLREYVVGDELRRVHWRTSARVGELMVRETRRHQPAPAGGAAGQPRRRAPGARAAAWPSRSRRRARRRRRSSPPRSRGPAGDPARWSSEPAGPDAAPSPLDRLAAAGPDPRRRATATLRERLRPAAPGPARRHAGLPHRPRWPARPGACRRAARGVPVGAGGGLRRGRADAGGRGRAGGGRRGRRRASSPPSGTGCAGGEASLRAGWPPPLALVGAAGGWPGSCSAGCTPDAC